jgi:hypothetical protein
LYAILPASEQHRRSGVLVLLTGFKLALYGRADDQIYFSRYLFAIDG